MFKNITSFFRFYYHIIRKSPQKYTIAMTHPQNFFTMITPLLFFLIYAFSSILFVPVEFIPLMFLWIPVILGNMYIVHVVSRRGYAIEREEYEKRKAFEREQRERERWRREAEEFKRQTEYERKMFEEYLRRAYQRAYYQQQQQYQRQQQQRWANEDRNMENAMKLLGLKEGFTMKDVKSAYRRLSKIHHPDVGGTEENFKRLKTAYDYVMARI